MKPINGSWLFNVDFEEIDTALTYAKFEKNKVTKQPELESVIKNKFLQEITMKTKFKVGDRVLVTKPTAQGVKTVDASNTWTVWIPDMDRFDKSVMTIYSIENDQYGIYKLFDGDGYCFQESWLTKVEEGIITEEPKAVQVAKQIDWEQRRWEMASKIFAETEDITLDSAVRQADIFIEYYKRTLKTINNT